MIIIAAINSALGIFFAVITWQDTRYPDEYTISTYALSNIVVAVVSLVVACGAFVRWCCVGVILTLLCTVFVSLVCQEI